MSSGMIELRQRLGERYGEKASRIMVVDMCQRRGLDPTKDEPTKEMWNEVH